MSNQKWTGPGLFTHFRFDFCTAGLQFGDDTKYHLVETINFIDVVCNLAALPILGIFDKILSRMVKNTSISLGNHFENFIREEVKSGRYGSVSEVIRSALRLLKREEKKERELIKALEVGENSGFVEDFDPKQHLKELHRKHL